MTQCSAVFNGITLLHRCGLDSGHVERGEPRHKCKTTECLVEWIDASPFANLLEQKQECSEERCYA